MPEPNGTVAYRVEQLEREQQRVRDRLHGLEANDNALNLRIQHGSDQLKYLEEDVKGIQKAVESMRRAMWGLLITGATIAVTLISGARFH